MHLLTYTMSIYSYIWGVRYSHNAGTCSNVNASLNTANSAKHGNMKTFQRAFMLSQHTKGCKDSTQHLHHSLVKLGTNGPNFVCTPNYISLSIMDLWAYSLILYWYFYNGMRGAIEAVCNSHSVLSYTC